MKIHTVGKYLLILTVTIALLLTACMPAVSNPANTGPNDMNQNDSGSKKPNGDSYLVVSNIHVE